ncbi:MAG: hypothetical protein ABW098_19350, partial [Candidatus Thiodiazotropha sp.]
LTPGRPKTVDDRAVEQIRGVINVDRRQTVREIAEVTGFSKTSVHRVLSEDLKMSRVCARWVPRLLKEEEKQRRVTASEAFLKRHEEDATFLSRIITTDETWLHYFEPEGKRQSSVWKTPATPPPKKARLSKSMGKRMFMVFLDRQGMILVHAVPAGQKINSAYYSQVLRRDLLNAIRKKRPALYENPGSILFHQDNAPSHTAENTNLEIDVLGFGRLAHPAYSPDLAPLDFAYFPQLKEHLRGQRFDDLDDLMSATLRYNRGLDTSWFEGVYDKWVKRHQRCIQHHGEYFEKE